MKRILLIIATEQIGIGAPIAPVRYLLPAQSFMRRTFKIIIALVLGLVLLVAMGLALIWWYDHVGQKADPNFNSTVQNPAYTTSHPHSSTKSSLAAISAISAALLPSSPTSTSTPGRIT